MALRQNFVKGTGLKPEMSNLFQSRAKFADPNVSWAKNLALVCQKPGEDQKKGLQSTNCDGCDGVLQSTNTKQIKGLTSATHVVSARGSIHHLLEKPLAGHFETFSGP